MRNKRWFGRGVGGLLLILFMTLPACQRSERPAPSARGESGVSGGEEAQAVSAAAAAQVLRDYFKAIQERRYSDAYAYWESGGSASGKSLTTFLNGWAQVASLEVTVGAPGAVGAAAGSRYIDIPVRCESRLTGGERQTTTGTYRLRRSVVDGATPEQRRWRIYSANVTGSGEAGNRV